MGSRVPATLRVDSNRSVEIAPETFLALGTYLGEAEYDDPNPVERKELKRAVIFISRKRAIELGIDVSETASSRIVLDVTQLVRDELVKIA